MALCFATKPKQNEVSRGKNEEGTKVTLPTALPQGDSSMWKAYFLGLALQLELCCPAAYTFVKILTNFTVLTSLRKSLYDKEP